MPLTVLVLAILVAIALMADSLVSEEEDVKVKNKLADFCVAVKAGDWTVLYRCPASGVLRFIDRIFGRKLFTLRYVIATVGLSALMSALFFCASMIWSYVHVLL